jgi:hypothetical protein
VRCAQDDQALHRQADQIEAQPVKSACFGGGEIRLDPDCLRVSTLSITSPARRLAPAASLIEFVLSATLRLTKRQGEERQDKTRRRSAMERMSGADFMQSAANKSAAKRLVERGYAEAYEPALPARQSREISNDAPERMQGFGRCNGRHDRCPRMLGVTQLFMFCSMIIQAAANVKKIQLGSELPR